MVKELHTPLDCLSIKDASILQGPSEATQKVRGYSELEGNLQTGARLSLIISISASYHFYFEVYKWLVQRT